MTRVKEAILVDGLSKHYGSSNKLAVDKLSLRVMPGEVYGFLGPNGAGKSTTIRLLMNFIQPTSGKGWILGRDIVDESVVIKHEVGYLAGEVALYPKMTGRSFLEYMAELHPPKQLVYAEELARRFRADLDTKVRDLSKGNRQKIGLLQAFMHKPKVLILDEPTSGLDPLMQEEFFKVLAEAIKDGGCAFVSSHNLAEVQRMCHRVGFIREGKLVTEQTISEVAAIAAQTFDITFAAKPPRTELASIKGAKVRVSGPNQLSVSLHGDLSPMFKILAAHQVAGINQKELNLEEEFLHFYKGEKQ